MEGKKIEKKDFYLVESDQTIALSCPTATCTYFTIFYFISLFTPFFIIYDTFQSILFLNDVRDTTNFTTYVLQIGMSPITKNNF